MNIPMPSIGMRSGNLPPVHDPRAVANYILDACELGGIRDVSNMKLQKLLYLAHREHLGAFGAPLVKLGFEAWDHGPVSPITYQSFKACAARPVNIRATMIDLETGHDIIVPYRLTADQEGIMDLVLARYARMSAAALRALTHTHGGAWDTVWSRMLLERSGTMISDEAILSELESGALERRLDG